MSLDVFETMMTVGGTLAACFLFASGKVINCVSPFQIQNQTEKSNSSCQCQCCKPSKKTPFPLVNRLYAYSLMTQPIQTFYADIYFEQIGVNVGFKTRGLPSFTQFVVPATGTYQISYCGTINADDEAGAQSFLVLANGVEISGSQNAWNPTYPNFVGIVTRTFLVDLQADDIIEVQVATNNGAGNANLVPQSVFTAPPISDKPVSASVEILQVAGPPKKCQCNSSQ